MTDAALASHHATGKSTPPFMAVFSEQLGLIGRDFWREFAILGAFLVLLTVVAVYEILAQRMTVDFPDEAVILAAGVGLYMGCSIWRGEKLYSQGHITTLPVARDRHILIRTLAGGVWLAGIVAWGLIWIAAMGLLSGGDLGIDRNLLLGPTGPEGQVAEGGFREIRWTPETWNWLSFFSAAAVFYLLGSAFMVGVRRKVLWLMVGVGVFLLLVANPFDMSDAVAEALVRDPLGLDNLLGGGSEKAHTTVTLPSGQSANAWRFVPSMQLWAPAAAAWLALGGGLAWLAAWRHRES